MIAVLIVKQVFGSKLHTNKVLSKSQRPKCLSLRYSDIVLSKTPNPVTLHVNWIIESWKHVLTNMLIT